MCGKKRALLFANGEAEPLDWLKSLVCQQDFVIAVDGGYRYTLAAGRMPDILVGDLDSVSPDDLRQVEQAGIEVVRYPQKKDETDLELALQLAIARGFKKLFVVGALGGRLDQTLANLFLLANPAFEGCEIRYLNHSEEVFLITGSVVLQGAEGDRVSLIPLGETVHGVCTQGLEYPLNGENLHPESTRGVSNVMLSDEAHISIRNGRLLCFHTRLDAPG